MPATQSDSGSFSALTTGAKVLALIAVALLPLGLLATYSTYSIIITTHRDALARDRAMIEASADQLDDAIVRTKIEILAVITTLSTGEQEAERCADTLSAFDAHEPDAISFVVLGDAGAVRCATPRFRGPISEPINSVALNTETGAIRIYIRDDQNGIAGIAELPPALVRQRSRLQNPLANSRIALRQNDQSFVLHSGDSAISAQGSETVEFTLADGEIIYVASFQHTPMRMVEMLTIVLPILMWLMAAFLGWYAVNRMILRPLNRLQGAVATYAAGDGEFDLPRFNSPALEIRDLGLAFANVVDTLKQSQSELAEGLAEQRRLTREVHHRVKNNLQVVASLLNLHARAAKTQDTAAAYASIQRRVDALAIVQRNLFAEIESDAGLPIRPVIAELASGLHQGASQDVALSMSLDVADVCVSQDIAVPVAFLITELVELAMLCSANPEVTIRLEKDEAATASLIVMSESLTQSRDQGDYSRYHRVLTGIARQLRNPLLESENFAGFEIAIPIISTED